MSITIGTDPEVFAVAKTTRKLTNCTGLSELDILSSTIPGIFALGVQPDNPKLHLPYGEVVPDGLAVEFTVDHTDNVLELVERIRCNLNATAQLVSNASDCTLSVNPRAYVSPKFIDLLPDEPYGKSCSLQLLGCDPDYNVYSMPIPEKPDPRNFYYRTSGGHIHMGMGRTFISDPAAVAYLTSMLDAAIGTAGTYLCNSPEAFLRKEMYGYPGMVRTSHPSGVVVEYRTLPAQALIQTPELSECMFTLAQNICLFASEVYRSAASQQEAISIYKACVGDYDTIMQRARAIIAHDTQECRRIQKQFATHVPDLNISSIVNALQAYIMPTDFQLYWE